MSTLSFRIQRLAIRIPAPSHWCSSSLDPSRDARFHSQGCHYSQHLDCDQGDYL